MATDEMAVNATPTRALVDLPSELLDRIISLLPPRDLTRLNATARVFHAAPPGGRSAVEHALRERMRTRGHERALPASLPTGVRTWTEELFSCERLLELACAHASPVSPGAQFSAFVDADGGLHTCGEEPVWAEDTGEPTGEYREHVAAGHPNTSAVRVPTRVASLTAVRVVAVAAGDAHLLALSDAGAVYGCGENEHGQVGLGDTQEPRAFVPIKIPANAPVVGIVAGRVHSLALSAAGCAYSWGYNSDGQLGHGDKEDRWEPTRIEALGGVRVGGMTAGGVHTLLLAVHGAVYSCGSSDAGQLGHGDQEEQPTPKRIEALAGVRAVHVSAGYVHSLVVDKEGGVHSFGYTISGCLGYRVREAVQLSPRPIEALAGVHAVRASCALSSSAVLGADGSVYTFGESRCGQLGLRRDRNAVQAPTRVSALAHVRVVRCAMGDSHSLFVSADGSVYACGRRSAALGLGMSAAERDEPARRTGTPTHVSTAWRARLSADAWLWPRPTAPVHDQ